MDLRFFQKLYEHSIFDEVKAIGKDIVIEGHHGHILGMTRKDKQVRLYILELCEPPEDLESCAKYGVQAREAFCEEQECENRKASHAESDYEMQKVHHRKSCMEDTHREQMKHSMKLERNRGFFMHIRSLQVGNSVLETTGATSGNMQNGDYSEAYLLFTQFLRAGWRVAENSPFYTVSWKRLAITNIELCEEMEQLPEWSDEVWITYDTSPKEHAVELPITLEIGKSEDLKFSSQDGRDVICYINGVYLTDVWAEEEKKFADPTYQERMLQHVSVEQLEQMKEQLFEGLAQICPKGMCFPVIEYECMENVGLRFMDKEYLDSTEKPCKGSTTSILMMMKPDAENGSHGLKLRACVIQTPVEPGTERVEAELFSYTEGIEKRKMRLVTCATGVPHLC